MLNLPTREQCPSQRATLTGGLNPADPRGGTWSRLLVEKTSLIALHSFSCTTLTHAPVARTCSTKVGLADAFLATRITAFDFSHLLPLVSDRYRHYLPIPSDPQRRRSHILRPFRSRDTGRNGAATGIGTWQGVPDAASSNGFPIYILPSSPRSGSWLATPSWNCRPGG
jgi:hypothetical protein